MSASWHSQIVSTFHPFRVSARLFLSSRRLLPSSFGTQKSRRDFGNRASAQLRVPMPETTMNEDDLAARPRTRGPDIPEAFVVEPVAIAKREDKLADKQLRARVLGAHARHDSDRSAE